MIEIRVEDQQFEFEDGVVVIGRGESCDLRIDDHRVSRRHAELRCVDSEWHLVDLESANGTYAVGRRIRHIDVHGATDVFLANPDDGIWLQLNPLGATATLVLGPDAADRTVRLGRARDNDIVLQDARASRYHADFVTHADGAEIVDLGSANGTQVNGQRVERAALQPGDLVEIGDTTLRLVQTSGRFQLEVVAEGATIHSEPGAAPEPGDVSWPGPTAVAKLGRLRAAPDQGTVTIAFTDIVDSTAIGRDLGDERWMAVLARHDAIVRTLLSEHGGVEVKHQGDGFMLGFASARNAVLFADAVQGALAHERASDARFPLRVRIGIHTGEAMEVEGDLFGHHVNVAARVARAARPDEVLVSRLVHDIVDAMGDLSFGEARLVPMKGIVEPYCVYPLASG
jgi:pSer/pThr/pTyr-binding forkhead associated (FHA) protein/class 3 adenylate cyclase